MVVSLFVRRNWTIGGKLQKNQKELEKDVFKNAIASACLAVIIGITAYAQASLILESLRAGGNLTGTMKILSVTLIAETIFFLYLVVQSIRYMFTKPQ